MGQQHDKKIGEWFGPNSIAHVLSALAKNDFRADIKIHVANDGVIYKSKIRDSFVEKSGQGLDQGLLVLVPIRLGVDTLNPTYFKALHDFFTLECCAGIAGGRPHSSLYFVGSEGDANLIYLDPHYIRNCNSDINLAVPVKSVDSYEKLDLVSYHCDKVRLLPLTSMDPSMVLGIYIKNLRGFDDFCECYEKVWLSYADVYRWEVDVFR